jgi:hypothetical protein
MDNISLNELRSLARRREIAAQRKVARIKRNTGAIVAGTEFDPRRAKGSIDRYNSQQLKAYVAKLDSFVSRKTQFEGGYRGAPISRTQWREYKRYERDYAQQVDNFYAKYADRVLPNNQTVASYMKQTHIPQAMFKTDPAVNSLYKAHTREASAMTGNDMVAKFAQQMKKKAQSGIECARKSSKRAATKMVREVDKQLYSKIKKMSNEQFDLLWNYSPFGAELALSYHSQQKDLVDEDSKLGWLESVMRDTLTTANVYADWALKQ